MSTGSFLIEAYMTVYSRFPSFCLLFFFCFQIFPVSAYDSWRVLDAFKSEQKRLLFENVPFWDGQQQDLLLEEYRMNGLAGVMKRVDAIKEQYEWQRDLMTQRRISLEEFIKQSDADIANKSYEIANTENTITVRQSEIAIKQQHLVDLQARIMKNKQTILQYLTYIYTEWDLLYDENQNIDVLRGIIMNDGDIQEVFSEIHYQWLISQVGQRFVDEYRWLMREYYSTVVALDEEVNRLTELEKNLEAQKLALEAERIERQRILDVTRWQESLYTEYVVAQENEQRTIQNAWKESYDRYNAKFQSLAKQYGCSLSHDPQSDSSECHEFRRFFEAEKSLGKSLEFLSGVTNIMSWPVPPTQPSALFHDAEYLSLLGSSHDAIDIPVPQATPIRVPMDGYVYYILPPTSWGYSYMAVKHANGFVTVYWHLSHVYAELFQVVRRGDVIGLTGWIPGTPGAGPMTSGAHLHFEVWKDANPVDPLRYLNIAPLKLSSLPSRYTEKYIHDLEEQKWGEIDTSAYESSFQIKGDTEEKRQTYLLKTYAATAFKERNIWNDVALDAKLDPSFLMCVWLAETSLGNSLKTPYNVGNVGNTDSGDTVTFSSAKEGITWMGKTFNNAYLGQYSRISDLSRWGNNYGLIYASSPENWHNNMIRCLSALKGRFIEDDFRFRLGPPANSQH